jgi:hypothetical protein
MQFASATEQSTLAPIAIALHAIAAAIVFRTIGSAIETIVLIQTMRRKGKS